MKTGVAMALGTRPLLAMTCWRCGQLKPESEFRRHPRHWSQPSYVDRRCIPCRYELFGQTRPGNRLR